MENCVGERKLLCAVIEQAYMDATAQRGQKAIKADAKRWLDSEDNYPFSYIWICEILHIDPSIVRRAVKSTAENNVDHNPSAAKLIPPFEWERRKDSLVVPRRGDSLLEQAHNSAQDPGPLNCGASLPL